MLIRFLTKDAEMLSTWALDASQFVMKYGESVLLYLGGTPHVYKIEHIVWVQNQDYQLQVDVIVSLRPDNYYALPPLRKAEDPPTKKFSFNN